MGQVIQPKKKFGYAVIAAGLCASVFITGVYCNKTYDLPLQSSASAQVYAKMESYTPVLVRKGFDVMVEQAKLGVPIRLEDYQKQSEDVLQKMAADKLEILSDPSQSALVGELSEKMIAAMDPVADNETAIAAFFKDLDKIAVNLIGRADNKQEANTVAFYASLFKSVILYYKNNPDALEQHEVLMDGYRNSKAGAETFSLFDVQRRIRTWWDRVKCRAKMMAFFGRIGSTIGQLGGTGGAVIGGVAGATVGAFVGRCRKGDPMP